MLSDRRYFIVRLRYNQPAGRHWIEESKQYATDPETAVAQAALESGGYIRDLDKATVEARDE